MQQIQSLQDSRIHLYSSPRLDSAARTKECFGVKHTNAPMFRGPTPPALGYPTRVTCVWQEILSCGRADISKLVQLFTNAKEFKTTVPVRPCDLMWPRFSLQLSAIRCTILLLAKRDVTAVNAPEYSLRSSFWMLTGRFSRLSGLTQWLIEAPGCDTRMKGSQDQHQLLRSIRHRAECRFPSKETTP